MDSLSDLRFSKYYLTKLYAVESNNSDMLIEGNNGLNLLCKEMHAPAMVSSM